jgi:hypothetical protein
MSARCACCKQSPGELMGQWNTRKCRAGFSNCQEVNKKCHPRQPGANGIRAAHDACRNGTEDSVVSSADERHAVPAWSVSASSTRPVPAPPWPSASTSHGTRQNAPSPPPHPRAPSAQIMPPSFLPMHACGPCLGATCRHGSQHGDAVQDRRLPGQHNTPLLATMTSDTDTPRRQTMPQAFAVL